MLHTHIYHWYSRTGKAFWWFQLISSFFVLCRFLSSMEPETKIFRLSIREKDTVISHQSGCCWVFPFDKGSITTPHLLVSDCEYLNSVPPPTSSIPTCSQQKLLHCSSVSLFHFICTSNVPYKSSYVKIFFCQTIVYWLSMPLSLCWPPAVLRLCCWNKKWKVCNFWPLSSLWLISALLPLLQPIAPGSPIVVVHHRYRSGTSLLKLIAPEEQISGQHPAKWIHLHR